MNQTEHRFDYPLTGSLCWWLCLTTKQTVIHMSVLWPLFHLEQFHGGRWKQKELTGQGFKPSFGTAAITAGGIQPPCFSLHLKQSLLCRLQHLPFQGRGKSDSEEFPSTRLSLFRRLGHCQTVSWFQCIYGQLYSWCSEVHLFWEVPQISFQSDISVTRTVPYTSRCNVELEW